MKITEESSSSAYHVYLLLALEDAACQFSYVNEKLRKSPPLSEENPSIELTDLRYTWERRRAVVIILAAVCVEALANLYLAHKTAPEQFEVLKWAKPTDKWLVLPTLFLKDFMIAKDSVLYKDLKRLFKQRNRIVHLQEEVSRSGEVIHQGKLPRSEGDEAAFIVRCAKLPLELAQLIEKFDPKNFGSLGLTVAFAKVWPPIGNWGSSWAKQFIGKKHMSVEDYRQLPPLPGAHYELVEGELAPVVMETICRNLVADRLLSSMNKSLEGNGSGVAVSLRPFWLLENTVRVPDLAFLGNRQALNPTDLPKGAPDLAVDIVPPERTAHEHYRRLSDYFAAGCKRVWVFHPEHHEVYIHGLAGVTRRRADEMLEDADLLPGFSVKVSEFFV